MLSVRFSTFPLVLNLVFFTAAGLMVWFAGVRLSTYADALTVRTRLSQAFLGIALFSRGAILAEMNRSAFVAGTIGLIVTSIFLLGLLERRNRTVLGMGVDSLAVLITYIVGLCGLYYVRNEPGF